MTSVRNAESAIRRALRDHGRLGVDVDRVTADADLGLSPQASLNVMLALEGEFEVEFPQRMLRQRVFRSIGSIERALRDLIAA